jgi:ketosteroid isomerase-like protein
MYTMTRLDASSAQEFARDFEDVFYQGNYQDMAAAYTADGKLFAEGAPVIEGRPAIEEFWKQAWRPRVHPQHRNPPDQRRPGQHRNPGHLRLAA